MKHPNSILLLSFIILLWTCKSKETRQSNVPDIKINIPEGDHSPPDVVYYTAATSIYGEWFNTNSDRSATLIFNNDGTFKYINETHPTDSVNGRWSTKGSDYLLRSSPKHNNGEPFDSKESSFQFEMKFRFKDGFLYEVNKGGSLSNDYFVQSQNYR